MLASKDSKTVYKLSPSQSLTNNTYETDNRFLGDIVTLQRSERRLGRAQVRAGGKCRF
jgi:hypothetical protein